MQQKHVLVFSAPCSNINSSYSSGVSKIIYMSFKRETGINKHMKCFTAVNDVTERPPRVITLSERFILTACSPNKSTPVLLYLNRKKLFSIQCLMSCPYSSALLSWCQTSVSFVLKHNWVSST